MVVVDRFVVAFHVDDNDTFVEEAPVIDIDKWPLVVMKGVHQLGWILIGKNVMGSAKVESGQFPTKFPNDPS